MNRFFPGKSTWFFSCLVWGGGGGPQ